jgi:hypothetical protein
MRRHSWSALYRLAAPISRSSWREKREDALPSLSIATRCRLEDCYLGVVDGKLSACRIHPRSAHQISGNTR